MSGANSKKYILVISNDTEFLSSIQELEIQFPVEFAVQQGSYEAVQFLRSKQAHLVILDYHISLISGDEMVRLVHQSYPEIPVIVLIEPLPASRKKEIIDQGAYDYLERPIDIELLKAKIHNYLFSEAYHFHVAALREKIKKTVGSENIIGDCPAMWKVFNAVNNISNSDVTVFISGESGTGKELLARAIYKSSLRKDKRFIVINCAAIPENLLESELFGHEKGSFSGAISQRIGKFELANSGTIFLDEIGEMSLYTQSKVLRLLEEQEFERVGGNSTIKVNVRIITATNKNLAEEVKSGRFREDLFYRVNVYPIELPPLRERIEDIPLLVFHFLEILSRRNNKEVISITPATLDLLKRYPWPGNIRELENVMERAILNSPGKLLTPDAFEHLSEIVVTAKLQKIPAVGSIQSPIHQQDAAQPLKIVEKIAIENALRISDGNISLAAKQLEIGRATLYRKMKEYGISYCKTRGGF